MEFLLYTNSTITITFDIFILQGGPHYPPGGVCGEDFRILVARRYECTPGMGRRPRTQKTYQTSNSVPMRALLKSEFV